MYIAWPHFQCFDYVSVLIADICKDIFECVIRTISQYRKSEFRTPDDMVLRQIFTMRSTMILFLAHHLFLLTDIFPEYLCASGQER